MKSWFSSAPKEQSAASEVKSADESVKSELGVTFAEQQHLSSASNKRARLDTPEGASPEQAAERLLALLRQLCRAALHPPMSDIQAESIKKLILELGEGEGASASFGARQVQDLMHAAFMAAKAEMWNGASSKEGSCRKTSDLSKLVEDALLVQCWLTRGLPAPKPLKSAQVAAIIADVLQEQEDGPEGPALDFHALADTSSQVVQVVGEVDAVRVFTPITRGRPLLMHVLLTVNGGGEDTGSAMTAHNLGLSKEDASRHAVALALAAATRPAACQLLHTMHMFEGALKAATADLDGQHE
mmetsp:Transcript_20231/g.56375  ORF Transcript_20231/g.56375 Transcript_20231/m.56375 type:complete len:300 (+) Transcript_20231:53-952(+)